MRRSRGVWSVAALVVVAAAAALTTFGRNADQAHADAVVQRSIVINAGAADGTDRVTLAPPSQASEADALTSEQALADFRNADPEFVEPDTLSAQLGLYTSASGPDSYRFRDQLAWGYSWQTMCPPSPNPAEAKAEPSQCTAWVFVDAHSGAMLEGTFQPA
jgi:hypothetical protein